MAHKIVIDNFVNYKYAGEKYNVSQKFFKGVLFYDKKVS